MLFSVNLKLWITEAKQFKQEGHSEVKQENCQEKWVFWESEIDERWREMKSWRATQAGLQKVMNIPWCGAILRNCHSEWSEIKIIFHPDKKKTNQYKSRKDICLPDAALNPRQGLTACTIKCQSNWNIKTVMIIQLTFQQEYRENSYTWIQCGHKPQLATFD